jgi:hypothetical protein
MALERNASVLLSVLGTPSAMTYALVEIVRVLAQFTFGHHSFVSANNVIDLKDGLSSLDSKDRRAIVYFSDFPDSQVSSILRAARAPMLVGAERFSEIVDFTMIARQISAVLAIRHATNGISHLAPILTSPKAKIVSSSSKQMTLRELLVEIADFYELMCDSSVYKNSVEFLGYGEDEDVSLDTVIKNWMVRRFQFQIVQPTLDMLDAGVIASIGTGYDAVLGGADIKSIRCPMTAFLTWEPPWEPMKGALHLVGPARLLSFGPFFHLPTGFWSADVVIEVGDCLSENRLRIDVVGREVLAGVTTTLPAFGVYGCSIQFQVNDPMLPIEVRIQMLTGAIEGLFLLRGATFTRLGVAGAAHFDGNQVESRDQGYAIVS